MKVSIQLTDEEILGLCYHKYKYDMDDDKWYKRAQELIFEEIYTISSRYMNGDYSYRTLNIEIDNDLVTRNIPFLFNMMADAKLGRPIDKYASRILSFFKDVYAVKLGSSVKYLPDEE